MNGLSRCGRPYKTFDSALLAAELRTSKGSKPLAVVSCDLGDHWHLVPPKAAINRNYSSPDPFPPVVAALLFKRDEVCQRCGFAGRLEKHHRRAKASGGSSARSHTQCACNGVRLCRSCHEWVHLNPRSARVDGWIVLQSVSRPGLVAVSRPLAKPGSPHQYYPDVPCGCGGSPAFGKPHRDPWYPSCDGGWNDQP